MSLFAASAVAQISNFSGYSASANLNSVSVNTKLDWSEGVIDGLGQQSWKVSTRIGYGLIANRNSVFTVGANYTFGTTRNGTVEVAASGQSLSVMKMKNQVALFVEPGLLIRDTTLAYGRISYDRAGLTLASEAGDESQTMNGIGFGFGIRTMLNKKAFVQAEFTQTGYRDIMWGGGALKSKINAGTAGLGFKF